jgi:uncharacterized membrane protein YccC
MVLGPDLRERASWALVALGLAAAVDAQSASMSWARSSRTDQSRRRIACPYTVQLASAARSVLAALLFGLRLWAAVCLALYVSFWIQLDNAQWAGTTAAIISQSSVGASLRKGTFRLVGTVIGVVMIVVLTAIFPQNRSGFLLGLAIWGAACTFFATVLRNNASYAAALAGYTAAVIASDALGATGGVSGDVFLLAIDRASAICIGILCAGIVIAGTALGGARHRLAALFASLGTEIAAGLTGTFLLGARNRAAARPAWRALVARVAALDPVVDEAIGEAADLRYRVSVLRAAAEGLLAAASGWRTVTISLERLSDRQARSEAEAILHRLPPEWRSAGIEGDTASWAADLARLLASTRTAVRDLVALPAGTPSQRLLADATARALLGLLRVFDALALLAGPARSLRKRSVARFRVPDPLPACINAARVFVTITTVALFWIVTAWPNGALALTFAAVGVILFSPREDQAYAVAQDFLIGLMVGAALASIVKFVLLPSAHDFVGFCLAFSLVLVPAGAFLTRTSHTSVFLAITIILVPLVGPTNQMVYNTQSFYNTAMGVIAGMGAAVLALVLLPPLPPAVRVRRLLALTLRDLRRLAAGRLAPAANDWEARIYGRFLALPPQAEPVQIAQLVAALSVGTEIIHLRHIGFQLALAPAIDAALDAVAKGRSTLATERLAEIDRRLAAVPSGMPGTSNRLRARGSIRMISEALAQHAAFSGSEIS